MSTASGARPNVAGERVSSQTQEQTEVLPTAGASASGVAAPTERFSTAEAKATTPAVAVEPGAAVPAPERGAAAADQSTEAAAEEAGGAARPTAAQRPATTRRVRLSMARVDPWSVMKISFLLSVAAGIAMVIATGVLWLVLSGLNVFNDLDRVIRDIQPATSEPFSVMDYIGFARVISLSVVIAVINMLLLTALSTLGAYLYNICSSLVGGVRMTLTDD